MLILIHDLSDCMVINVIVKAIYYKSFQNDTVVDMQSS